jgi:hypothetical protein
MSVKTLKTKNIISSKKWIFATPPTVENAKQHLRVGRISRGVI